ncbi:MAG: hypothetical protein WAK63_09785 [Xanthobacteraceae bacterium]
MSFVLISAPARSPHGKKKDAHRLAGAPFAWMGRVTNAAAQFVEIAQIVSISAMTIPVRLRFAGALRQVPTLETLVLVMLSSFFAPTQNRISVSKKATATNRTAGFEPAPIPEAQMQKEHTANSARKVKLIQ